MRLFLASAAVLALSVAGCGSSSSGSCQAVSNAVAGWNQKETPCNTDGGSTSVGTQSFDMTTCNNACSSSSDQTTLNNVANCINNLPTCDPNNETPFFAGFLGCTASGPLSSQCHAAFNSSSGGDH